MSTNYGPVKRPIASEDLASETMPPEFKKYVIKDDQDSPQNESSDPVAIEANPLNQPHSAPRSQSGVVDPNDLLQSMLSKLKTHVYQEVRLPSLGRFYDGKNGPSDGVIHLREMTGREEEILGTPNLVKSGVALSMIFNQCMRENFDSNNFLVVDRAYMLIFLRAMTYGTTYSTRVKDPETGQEFNYDVDLNSLSLTHCPQDFGPESLQDILPSSGFPFRYRLETGNDELKLLRRSDQRAKNYSNTTDDSFAYKMSLLVEDINGLTDKEAILAIVKEIHALDRAKLRSCLQAPFGVDTDITVFNPFSASEFVVPLPMGPSFFSPAFPTKTEKSQ